MSKIFCEEEYFPPYQLAIGAGYQDTWTMQSEFDNGFTSGFDDDVSNVDFEFPTSQNGFRLMGSEEPSNRISAAVQLSLFNSN